jgi:sugar phosphate isomerase/epimerase
MKSNERPQDLAVQLWTVRSLCEDARGLASTLTALGAIGYRAAELAGLQTVPPGDVRRIMEDTGIECCSAHADSRQLLENPSSVVTTLRALGCGAVAYPHPRDQDFSSPEGVSMLCRRLSEAAAVFQSEGISFSYHHHSLELRRLDQRTILSMILDQTDPGLVQVELDTYWLQAGGVDPARWIARCAGRIPLLHLKDYGVDPEGRPLFREIGSGNLDWNEILPAAKNAGCRWLIVEQDDHWSTGNPLESLATSWRYLAQPRGR